MASPLHLADVPRVRLPGWVEWVILSAAAVFLAFLVNTYVAQVFVIPTASMEPTLSAGDRIVVNKLSYRLHDLNRGDLVVFERPPGATGDVEDFVKRVIGLPGETVVARDGRVFIDGRELAEPYLEPGTLTTRLDEPVTVPDGHVFVLGDNRSSSLDSRSFGAISERAVIGRAFVRIWPPLEPTWL